MPLLPKEIIAPDDYHTSEGVVRATPRRIRWWLAQFRRMKAKGLPVPVPWEHQEDAKPQTAEERLANDAKHNAGWVADMFLDRRGALWGVLDVPDAADAQKIQTSVKFVSPEIDDEWQDGDGEAWHDIITHVALTPRPVYYKQKPFGTLAKMSFSRARSVRLSMNQRLHNEEVRKMASDDYQATDDEGSSDGDLLQEAIELLDSKLGLHMPSDHIGTDTFLRDLVVALTAFPGTADEDDDADTDATDLTQDDDEQPVTTMGNRRGKLSQPRKPYRRVSAERGKAAAAEQLRNSGIRLA